MSVGGRWSVKKMAAEAENKMNLSSVAFDDEPGMDYGIVGENLKRFRQFRKLSTRALAHEAQVSRATLIRAEHGFPVRPDVLKRLCVALETRLAELCLPVSNPRLSIHRHSDEHWVMVAGQVPAPRKYHPTQLEDPKERARLAKLGWAARFTQHFSHNTLESALRFGLMEVYGKQESPARHPGEEFLFCVQGCLRLTVDGEVIELDEGDSARFDADLSHEYEPVHPYSMAIAHFTIRHSSRKNAETLID